MSNRPSSFKNLVRLMDERLQAVSSKNMYSLHGLDALMRSVPAHVCQSLMVVSYCTPGSAQAHAASASFFHRSRAGSVLATWPVVRSYVRPSPSSSTAFMNASVTRTELLEFCPLTVW